MEKEEGEAAGCLSDNSGFISMLVYLFVFLSVLLAFFVRFSVSSPFKGTTLIWMEYRITLPVCVRICLFNVHLFLRR